MKKIISFIMGTAILLLLAGCQPTVQNLPERMPVPVGYAARGNVEIANHNDKGELETKVFDRPPQRVAAVWQNSVETLLALGVGDRIVFSVGVPDRKYLKEEYRDAYDVIPYKSTENPDLETVLMQQPDFILGWNSTFSARNLRGSDFWQARGVNTYIAESSRGLNRKYQYLEDEYAYILDMGRIFDRNEQAQRLVAEMQQEIERVKSATAQYPVRPKAMIIDGVGKNIRTYGEKTLAADIMKNLNGELVAQEGSLSLEELVKINPDVIFVVVSENGYDKGDMALAPLYNQPALRQLDCIKNRRLYVVPLYAVYSSATRTYDGIKKIAQGLYPELYGE